MIQTEFSAALNQVCSERGLEPEQVIETIEEALVTAFKKDHPEENIEELRAEINHETGAVKVFRNDEDVTPSGFGRIAAQTAKQVLFQRVREAEKEALAETYRQKVGGITHGYIFRKERGTVILDLEKAQGVMPPSEQIPNEDYRLNQQIKVIISEVREGTHGPEIVVSRAQPEFVKQLFALEVPEIDSGTVTIEAVAREAGKRTKIATSSTSKNVDPVGSLVGQKGIRVQAVIKELGEEKIDIVEYNSDPEIFIANALSPAKVKDVKLDEDKKTATIEVPEDQVSLAIGKGGQNVRLAAKLTGWRINIQSPERALRGEDSGDTTGTEASELATLGLTTRIVNALESAGISSSQQLQELPEKNLGEIKGIGPKAVENIKEVLNTVAKDKSSLPEETTSE